MKLEPTGFNFVKAWIKTLHLNNFKCPSEGFKVLSHYYENSKTYGMELLTKIDDNTGTLCK